MSPPVSPRDGPPARPRWRHGAPAHLRKCCTQRRDAASIPVSIATVLASSIADGDTAVLEMTNEFPGRARDTNRARCPSSVITTNHEHHRANDTTTPIRPRQRWSTGVHHVTLRFARRKFQRPLTPQPTAGGAVNPCRPDSIGASPLVVRSTRASSTPSGVRSSRPRTGAGATAPGGGVMVLPPALGRGYGGTGGLGTGGKAGAPYGLYQTAHRPGHGRQRISSRRRDQDRYVGQLPHRRRWSAPAARSAPSGGAVQAAVFT
jgi:hypothetical protein